DVSEAGVITNVALGQPIVIPEWALLYTNNSVAADVTGASGAIGGTATHHPGAGTNGDVTFVDAAPAGGSFNFTTTNAETFNEGVSQDTVGTVDGTANNDILISTTSTATLQGNAGNDVLIAGGGNDTYVFGLNDGSDIVSDAGGGGDTISIVGTPITNLNFERVGTDLVMDAGSTHVTVKDHYGTGTVENLIFANGGTIYGYALNTTGYKISADATSPLNEGGTQDVIASSSSAEIATAGGGNDLVFGNGGNDTLNGEG